MVTKLRRNGTGLMVEQKYCHTDYYFHDLMNTIRINSKLTKFMYLGEATKQTTSMFKSLYIYLLNHSE